MAVRGLGVDVVKVERLAQALERFGERMERRLFTEAERTYCRSHKDPLPHFAARFAAKEAAFKAIGTGLSGGVGWKQAEVIQPGGRQPKLALHDVALERFRAIGCTDTHVSLTHDGGFAIRTRRMGVRRSSVDARVVAGGRSRRGRHPVAPGGAD